MRHTIADGPLAFTSDSLGVAPISLRFEGDAFDYVWSPDDRSHPGTAICFPLLGAVPGDGYRLGGHRYEMGMHGFAQHLDFDASLSEDGKGIRYAAQETAHTLKQFPFPFRLSVSYSLDRNRLTTRYEVQNTGDSDLPFSIGAHPRFAYRADAEHPGTSAISLEFAEPEGAGRLVKVLGSREAVEQGFSADGRTLQLDDRMFDGGAFCFGRLESSHVTLRSATSSHAIRMDIPDTSYFQLWSMPGAAYVCLEPWYGSITSKPPAVHDGDWELRPGTLIAAPGATVAREFTVTVLR